MPTVLVILNYLWVIHTRDHGYPHVTIYKGRPGNYEAKAKVRLDQIEVIENDKFNPRSLNKILKFTEEFQEFLLDEWSKYHEKNKIVYGNVDIPEELDPKNAKVKITMWIDGDILLELRKRAEKSKGKYQTLMNEVLREYLFNEKSAHKLEIENIVENKLKALGLLKKRA